MPGHQLTRSLKTEFYRKAIHISSLWIPLFIWFMPQIEAAAVLLCIAAIDFAVEYLSFKNTCNLNRIIKKNLIKTMRYNEIQTEVFTLSGAFYVLVASFCVTLLFPKPIACAALCILLVSDTAAALVGRFCGRTRLSPGKSLEGTTAFFVSALAVLAAFTPVLPFSAVGIAAAVAATLAEYYAPRLKIDDNFTIPLAFGIAFMLL